MPLLFNALLVPYLADNGLFHKCILELSELVSILKHRLLNAVLPNLQLEAVRVCQQKWRCHVQFEVSKLSFSIAKFNSISAEDIE